MTHPWSLTHLPEDSLRSKLIAVVERDRRTTASLLAYLAEFDRRELWTHEGVSSTFAFCTERLGMSESEAYKRIWVARIARKYPAIFTMVAEGRLHLSAVIAVGTLLTEENHRSVLARIEHKSKREIERIVAELAPRPDVPSKVRALPQRRLIATLPPEVSSSQGMHQAPEPSELPLPLTAPHGGRPLRRRLSGLNSRKSISRSTEAALGNFSSRSVPCSHWPGKPR